MDVLKRFQQAVDGSLSVRRGAELHISDLVHTCPRKIYTNIISRKNPKPLEWGTKLRFWIGNAIHEPPILKHHHLKLVWEGIHAEVDEYEDGIVLEKKHTTYLSDRLPKHYERQGEYYKAMLVKCGYPVEEVHVLLIDIVAPDAKDFLVQTRAVDEIAKEILFKRDLLNYSLKFCLFPAAIRGDDCKYCGHAEACESENL